MGNEETENDVYLLGKWLSYCEASGQVDSEQLGQPKNILVSGNTDFEKYQGGSVNFVYPHKKHKGRKTFWEVILTLLF